MSRVTYLVFASCVVLFAVMSDLRMPFEPWLFAGALILCIGFASDDILLQLRKLEKGS